MSQLQEIIAIAVVVAIAGVGLVVGLLRPGRRSTKQLPPTRPQPGRDYAPGVGDDAEVPRDTPTRRIEDVSGVDTLPAPEVEEPELPPTPGIERPAPVGGRVATVGLRAPRCGQRPPAARGAFAAPGGSSSPAGFIWENRGL